MDNYELFDLALQEYEQNNSSEQNIEEIDGCKHLDVTDENGIQICCECGEELSRDFNYDKEWRYYGSDDTRRSADPNRCHIRKCEDRTIFKDVENLGFSDRIVGIANDMYIQVTNGKIYRGNSRKAIVFACVYHAFKAIDKPLSCDSLREIFALERKIVLKGLKHVMKHLPKDSNLRTKYITPIELVEEIMDKFNASKEQKEEVVKLYELIRNKSSKLNRSRPQSVASGLIYFYISHHNKDINIKDFTKKVKLSELTVNNISKEIEKILSNKSENSLVSF
jgi:hypothetical protein